MSVRALSKARNFPSVINDFFQHWNDLFYDDAFTKAKTLPNVNITEDKNGYTLSVAAPGLHKKDFNIGLKGNLLTISGHKEESKEEKEENYTHQEYNYSAFNRSFTLPEDVEQSKIDASYDGGILKLILPKNAKAAKQQQASIAIK